MKNKFKVFVINPGSTSTKIALFMGEEKVFSKTLDCDADEMKKFKRINDQLSVRIQGIEEEIAASGIDLSDVDAFSARSGALVSMEGGVYKVNEKMLEHVRTAFTADHPNILGPQIAKLLQTKYGGEVFTVNPPDVDELDELDRVCGFHEFSRASKDHPLNQKENAIRYARSKGKKYGEINLIICHLGGGVTVAAHKKGRMVSLNNCLEGDGPMAPTRSGSLPAVDLIRMCYSKKYTESEMYRRITREGGLVDHLGTSDIREINRRIQAGDRYAKLIYEAFIYQIGKAVGGCAAVLKGKVDAIILTGGISNDAYLVEKLSEYISWLAPVSVQAGEFEMEALAAGAIRVMNGEEEAKEYTGIPVWKGFKNLEEDK